MIRFARGAECGEWASSGEEASCPNTLAKPSNPTPAVPRDSKRRRENGMMGGTGDRSPLEGMTGLGPKEELVGAQQGLAVLLPGRELTIETPVGSVAEEVAAQSQFLPGWRTADGQS